MNIKKASAENLAEILAVYETARSFMCKNGNPTQWSGGYPQDDCQEHRYRHGQGCYRKP